MRGLVDGLDTPLPLLLALPGPYQEDYFTARFVGAFDDALAPVLCTLDSLAAYVDPDLAPGDFVNFVAAWVGTELDEQSSLAERRVAVRSAVTAYRRRGTVRGLTELAARVTGGDVDITESGGRGGPPRPAPTCPAARRCRCGSGWSWTTPMPSTWPGYVPCWGKPPPCTCRSSSRWWGDEPSGWVATMKICEQCGAPTQPGESFCGSCGAYLEWADESPDQPGPVATGPPAWTGPEVAVGAKGAEEAPGVPRLRHPFSAGPRTARGTNPSTRSLPRSPRPGKGLHRRWRPSGRPPSGRGRRYIVRPGESCPPRTVDRCPARPSARTAARATCPRAGSADAVGPTSSTPPLCPSCPGTGGCSTGRRAPHAWRGPGRSGAGRCAASTADSASSCCSW